MPFSEQSKFTSLHLSYADPYTGSETEYDYFAAFYGLLQYIHAAMLQHAAP
jgi:hypothetical protein